MKCRVPDYARSWTESEDAAIREHYADGGAAAVLPFLKERSDRSVQQRARRLGVFRKRRWTPADIRKLRTLWDSTDPLSKIAKHLGRSEYSTYGKAKQIGLPLGVPEGCEYLQAAAARTGYRTEDLRRILKRAEIEIHLVRTDRSRRTKHSRHYVDPFEVDLAVEKWHDTETVKFASSRHGISDWTLGKWLKDAGVPRRNRKRNEHWRVESAVIDRVVAERFPTSKVAAMRAKGIEER